MKRWIIYHLKHNSFLVFVVGIIVGDIAFWESWDIMYLMVLVAFLLVYGKSFKVALVLAVALFLGIYLGMQYENKYFLGVEEDINSVEFEGYIDSVYRNGAEKKVVVNSPNHGKVLITYTTLENVRLGDCVTVSGRLRVPGEFDSFSYKDFLRVSRINYVMYHPGSLKGIVCSGFMQDWYGLIGGIRESVSRFFRRNLDEPGAALLIGMTLGLDQEYSTEFERNILVTGTSHIVAVSGFNVMLILGWMMILTKPFGKKVGLIISVFSILLFWGIVGTGNAPATRAVFVAVLYSAVNFFGRKIHMVYGLIYVAGLMILLNPLIYSSISFQLSMGAVMGISIFTERVGQYLMFLPELFRDEAAVSIGAILGTLPLTLGVFGSFSIHSLLVNVLVAPVIGLITILGLLSYAVSLIFPWVSQVGIWFLRIVLEYMIMVINWGGSYEYLYIEGVDISSLKVLFIIVVICVLGVGWEYRKFRNNLLASH